MTEAAMDAVAVQQNLQVMRMFVALLRGKRSVLMWGLGGAVLLYAASLLLKPYYKASTTLLPPQTRASTAVGMLGQLSLGGGDGGGLASLGSAFQAKAQGDSFVVLMTAWPVEDAVVRHLNLQAVYKARTAERARLVLAKHTSAVSEKGFVTVSVTDGDAARAAAVANDYISSVRESMRDMALTEASQRRMFYEGQLGKVKEDLAQAEMNFKGMQQSSRMVSLDSQARLLIESAAGLRAQITAQEVEVQRLRSYLTDGNPQLQIAETNLGALRGELARTESQNRGGFTGAGLTSVPGAELEFVRATRELKYREGLFDLMVKQYEASRIDEARTAPVVQVVEPAFVPETKDGPHRSLFALGGLALGMVLRMGVLVFRFWRSTLDGEDATRLTELGRAAFRW